jgi:hypothetical protein
MQALGRQFEKGNKINFGITDKVIVNTLWSLASLDNE